MAFDYRTEPRPYQQAIVEQTASMPYLALWLKQGLGKTKIVLDSAAAQYVAGELEALIVVSKTSVVENWLHEEVPKHLGVPYHVVHYSADKKKRIAPPDRLPSNCLKVVLINDGCVRTDHGLAYLNKVMARYRTGLVVDESTIIKNPSALITQRLTMLGAQAVWRRLLSGEPATQGPVDYFSQYRFLSPDILGVRSFTAYKNMFCDQKEVWVNGRLIRTPQRDFANDLARDLFEDRVRPFTIRLRKEDVLPDLPEKQYIVRKYELPPAIRSAYDRLRNEFMTELVIAESAGTLTATMAISRATRLHQMVSGHVVLDDGRTMAIDSGRLQALFDILDERPEGAKTIIWAHYRHTIDQLMEALEERYGRQCARRIYGSLSENDRTTALSDFKSRPNVRFLVANPATAGWGITLTEADAAVYFCNSYNWEHRDQSEDRIHRIGQEANSVMYFDLVAVDTVDEKILEVLQSKADFSRAVMTDFGEWFK